MMNTNACKACQFLSFLWVLSLFVPPIQAEPEIGFSLSTGTAHHLTTYEENSPLNHNSSGESLGIDYQWNFSSVISNTSLNLFMVSSVEKFSSTQEEFSEHLGRIEQGGHGEIGIGLRYWFENCSDLFFDCFLGVRLGLYKEVLAFEKDDVPSDMNFGGGIIVGASSEVPDSFLQGWFFFVSVSEAQVHYGKYKQRHTNITLIEESSPRVQGFRIHVGYRWNP